MVIFTVMLSRTTLRNLRSWWFQGCPSSPEMIAPKEVFQRWFQASDEIDKRCKTEYGPAVEAARSMSVEEIQSIIETPQDALAAVVLLDQMPRNIFRGPETEQVHTVFDPKALALAKSYLAPPFEYGDRKHFPVFLEQCMLLMPLMHSESSADHELFDNIVGTRSKQAESDAERSGIQMVQNFGTKHHNVIKRFGRYPSRNECLGRESTAEEKEFLKDGPGW